MARSPRRTLPLSEEELYQRAVAALARRDRSVAEMRRWLRARAVGPAGPRTAPDARREAAPAGAIDVVVDAVLARLRDHGYLDDARLASSFALYQKEITRHGRARALRDLRARGVDASTAERGIRHGYAGANDDALLRAYILKKRTRRPETLREAASLYRKWMTAGFGAATIQAALRRWKLDPQWTETLDAAELSAAHNEFESGE